MLVIDMNKVNVSRDAVPLMKAVNSSLLLLIMYVAPSLVILSLISGIMRLAPLLHLLHQHQDQLHQRLRRDHRP
jgi:hypothetical protein